MIARIIEAAPQTKDTMHESRFTPEQIKTITKNTILRLSSSVFCEDLAEAVEKTISDFKPPATGLQSSLQIRVQISEMLNARELVHGVDTFLRTDQPFLPGFKLTWTTHSLFPEPETFSGDLLTATRILHANLRWAEERKFERRNQAYMTYTPITSSVSEKSPLFHSA